MHHFTKAIRANHEQISSQEKMWIDQIVAKLYNEGISKSNYTKDEALDVLNSCVAPKLLVGLLNNFEEEIVKLLPLWGIKQW